jgi:hypothetical protein
VKGERKLRTEDGYIVRRVLNGEPEELAGISTDPYHDDAGYESLHEALDSLPDSLLSSQAKVLKTGEIPVDILNASQIPAISSKHGSGDDGSLVPSVQQRAFFLAPSAENDTWMRKADMPTPRYGLATSAVNGKSYAIGGIKSVQAASPCRSRRACKLYHPTSVL